MNKDGLLCHLSSLGRKIKGLGRSKGGEKPQSKGDNNKKEDTRHKLIQWIAANAERVNKMKEPLTFEQCDKLKEDFHNEFIIEILTSMHNYEPLLRKNRSANWTFRNWAKRDERYKKWREAKGLIEIKMNT